MKCPVCGSNNPTSSEFCSVCGTILFQKPPASPLDNQSTTPPPTPPFPPHKGGSGLPPRHPHRKKFLLVAAAIAVVAALGICAFLVFGNGQNQKDNEVILQDNVFIYDTEHPAFDIVSFDSNSYLLTISDIGGITEDSTLVFPITDKTPNGALLRVKSITQTDAGYEIQTEQAALTDAIAKCNYSSETALLQDGDTQEIETPDEISSGFTQAKAAENAGGYKAASYNDGTVSFDLTLALESGLKINWGDVDMKLGIRVGIEGGVDLKTRQVLDATNKLFNFNRSIQLMVGPVPVVLSNEIVASLPVHMESSANLNESFSLEKVYGFHYTTKDGMKPLENGDASSDGPQFDAGATANISANVDVGIVLSYSCMVYGFAGPQITATLDGKISTSMTVATGTVTVENPITIPGTDLKAWGSIDASVTVPISGKFVLKIPNINLFDNSENKLEVELFNTGDAITLWTYSLKTQGPVIYDDTTAGQKPGVPIEGTLHVVRFKDSIYYKYAMDAEEQAKKHGYYDGSDIKCNPDDYYAYIDNINNVTVPAWVTQNVGPFTLPSGQEIDAYDGLLLKRLWGQQTHGNNKDQLILFCMGSDAPEYAKTLLPYNGKRVIVTPSIVSSGVAAGAEASEQYLGGGLSGEFPDDIVFHNNTLRAADSKGTNFPGTTFKIQLKD